MNNSDIRDKIKIIRITTVAVSMNIILKNQLRYMNNFFEIIGITSYDEKHFEDVKNREGIRVADVDINRNISLFKDFISLVKLYLKFREEKPMIVHTHTPKAGLLGMIAAKLAAVPVRLHTVGGLPQTDIKGFKKNVLDLTERLTYRFAHRVYPNSFGLKEYILNQRYCQETKLKVLAHGSSNGVDTDFFNPNYITNKVEFIEELKSKIGILKNELVLLFVGRIAKDKGINELVDTFNSLINEGMSLKLVLVGKFEKDYGALEEKVKDSILNNDKIKFLGRFDDVRPYYLISDIFVLPSYREGFPNAVLEAQSMSLPCIVTNINGCNEIIKDNFNGLLVEPKDRSTLKQALKSLILDKSLREKLSNNSRTNIVNKFQRNVIWSALKEEYDFFIKQKKK